MVVSLPPVTSHVPRRPLEYSICHCRRTCHWDGNKVVRLKQATTGLRAGLEVDFCSANGPAFRPIQDSCGSA